MQSTIQSLVSSQSQVSHWSMRHCVHTGLHGGGKASTLSGSALARLDQTSQAESDMEAALGPSATRARSMRIEGGL